MRTICDLLSKNSSKKVLHFADGFQKRASFTYAELKAESEKLAHALIRRGIQREPVIISLPNSGDFAVSYFGVLMAGAIPVTLTTADYVTRDYFSVLSKHISGITGARFALSFAGRLGDTTVQVLNPQELVKEAISDRTLPLIDEGQLALIQFSSGSTVEPKGVMLTHKNILANLAQIQQGMQVTPKDVLTSWLPFYHDMGLIGGLLSALFNEVESYFETPSDFIASPAKWFGQVASTGTTIMMGPNFLYRHLCKRITSDEKKSLNLRSLRLALSGAEPVSPATCRDFINAFAECGLHSSVVFPVYGMAENTLAVTFPRVGENFRSMKLDRDQLALGLATEIDAQDFAQKSANDLEFVSCGFPLKDIELRIAGADGRSLADGQIGEIQYQSPSMTSGYWRSPELTQELFTVDGWLKTGDLGFLHRGELFVTGRSKDVLILNGRKYFPQDLENASQQIPEYRAGRTAAFSYRQNDQDEYALVVETKEWKPQRREDLKAVIAEKCYQMTFKKPQQVYLVAPCALPRTSSGKLKRFVLREWREKNLLQKREGRFVWDWILVEARMILEALKYVRKNRSFRKSNSEVAQQPDPMPQLLLQYLTQMFSEVIQQPAKSVDPQKSFLEYQLDSIQIVQLNSKLKNKSIEIPLIEFIGIQNLNQLRDYLMLHHEKQLDQLRENR